MLETVTNPDESTVNYDYDVLDELIEKSYDEDEDVQALYGYDLDGNRITMDDVAGTTEYEYDEIGRITAVNLTSGKQIKYSYDEYGNLAKLTYPDNTTVQYTYNELDQLTQIKDRQNKVTTYERDANGNITKVTRPNSTYTTIEYDDMGQITKLVNMGKNPYYNTKKELSSFAYIYDQSGFIKSETAKSGNKVTVNLYDYDQRGQIIQTTTTVTNNGSLIETTTLNYTYDNAGNRLTSVKTTNNKLMCDIKYTYDDNSQLTDIENNCGDDSKYKHVVLSYDKNGNLVRYASSETNDVQEYTYDNENRLKAITENGSLLMAALYDGDGERIFRLDSRQNAQYTSNKGGTAESVIYSTGAGSGIAYDHDMIMDEMLIPNGIDDKNAINYELTGYINDINTEYSQVLMEYGASQSVTNIYEYGAQRNSATINGTKGYYLYDGRGSVASLSGSNGSNTISYSYDAYGNTAKSSTLINNPYQYNAEYTDSSTGYQYLRARYYDASTGRFLTKDTVLGSTEKPLSRNLYAYVENNPVNYADPSGHRKQPFISPLDQAKINKKIEKAASDPFSKAYTILDPKERQAFYDKQIENIYGEYFYGPSYSNPTGPYRYDPVKNPFGQGKNRSKRKEAQTVLQRYIAKVKEENYKKYCENGVPKAKDDGKYRPYDKSTIYGIMVDNLNSALDVIEELLSSVGFKNNINLGEISEKLGMGAAITFGIADIYQHIKENQENNSSPKKIIIDIVVDALEIGATYAAGGLASQCLSYARQIAQEQNCYKIMLLTGSKKRSTHRFYRKNGYNSIEKTGYIQRL